MRYIYIYKQKVPGYRNTWVEIEQKNTTFHYLKEIRTQVLSILGQK